MIKDKITPDLKNKFRDAIKKTIKNGKEYGFILCADNKGDLFPTRTCTGNECEIKLRFECPSYLIKQGDFHTHPLVSDKKKSFEAELHTTIPYENIKKIIFDDFKRRHKTPSEPSNSDLLVSLRQKRNNKSLGSSCIISDVEPKILECWSPKYISNEHYEKAEKELPAAGEKSPLNWLRPLFDKEIIDLNQL